ncbi:MAG TPA: DNA replication/repair protein RecF [Fimbriimonas sp.]|nr:DNA replication/repair protein RecF [Fimbriimonas sp.]
MRLEHFRNFESLSLDLSPGFTILAGANAQGKTSLLEAVYWISTTRMLRGNRDGEAIQEGRDSCQVDVELEAGTQISAHLAQGQRKKFSLNGMGLPRASDVLGRLPSTVISMFDLEIVRGDPAQRRMFLDLELSSLRPVYLKHLTIYKKSLEQRNALLKQAAERFVDDYAFETYEEGLATSGAEIRRMRQEFIDCLNPLCDAHHFAIASQPEKCQLSICLKDSNETVDTLRETFASTRNQDIHRGSTQIGPHRDDLAITIDGKEAKTFGSQGQQRTAVIALKLATLEHSRNEIGESPMLLLDDMLSDLDPVRRARLCHVVSGLAQQAFLTCTEASAAGDEIISRSEVLEVHNGTVRRA